MIEGWVEGQRGGSWVRSYEHCDLACRRTCGLNYLCMQVVAAGANPIQITRGIDKTISALVKELKLLSKEVRTRSVRFL
jgi:hypothetical protein